MIIGNLFLRLAKCTTKVGEVLSGSYQPYTILVTQAEPAKDQVIDPTKSFYTKDEIFKIRHEKIDLPLSEEESASTLFSLEQK